MSNNSAIAFWSSQANDNSAGQQDALSGNRHPAGYASAQRWSATAAQWNAEYRTQYGIGHDTAGQTPSGPAPIAGTTHPSGWVSGQAQSVSAQQWHDMWAAEWANARDPQGFAYSYPGQAAYAVMWSQSAAYWQGQYNAEVGAYTAITPSALHQLTAAGGSGIAITLDKTGTWDIAVILHGGSVTGGTGGVAQFNLTVGGSVVNFTERLFPGSSSMGTGDVRWGYFATATVGAGGTINVTNDTGFACTFNPNNSWTITATFVPNPTYPH
jgi:hypothetical protein